MPWNSVSLRDLCKRFGIDYDEHTQKHELIDRIISQRKKQRLSQAELAKLVGISQPRIARIESGINAHKISFESLFKILAVLGCGYRVVVRSNAGRKKLAA